GQRSMPLGLAQASPLHELLKSGTRLANGDEPGLLTNLAQHPDPVGPGRCRNRCCGCRRHRAEAQEVPSLLVHWLPPVPVRAGFGPLDRSWSGKFHALPPCSRYAIIGDEGVVIDRSIPTRWRAKEVLMRRAAAVTMLVVMVLVPLLWTADAFARAGGGSSGGSRGSRSYSAPARSSPSQVSPSSPASRPPSPMQPAPAPQRPGWGGMIGGLLMGGLIGSLLFGGLGHGFGGGGMGLLEILLIAGLVYFGFRMLRNRQPQPASPAGYASTGSYRRAAGPPRYAGTPIELPARRSHPGH